jgi:hypothetical protein
LSVRDRELFGFEDGAALQAAKKSVFASVLKGRSFSCAVTASYFCHPEEGFSPTRDLLLNSDAAVKIAAGTSTSRN